jgi:hypothetical protein
MTKTPAYSPALIQEYLEAFKAANTMAEVPQITYSDGHYIFKTSRGYPQKYRRAAVESMRDVLRKRMEKSSEKVA